LAEKRTHSDEHSVYVYAHKENNNLPSYFLPNSYHVVQYTDFRDTDRLDGCRPPCLVDEGKLAKELPLVQLSNLVSGFVPDRHLAFAKDKHLLGGLARGDKVVFGEVNAQLQEETDWSAGKGVRKLRTKIQQRASIVGCKRLEELHTLL